MERTIRTLMVLALLPQILAAQKTNFQTAGPWHAALDVQTDAVIVYGMNDSFEARMESWKRQGYNIQFMTSSSWGHNDFYSLSDTSFNYYKNFAQTRGSGQIRMHGKKSFYIVPDASFTEYLSGQIEKAIDYGATAIYLEEPEYFNYTGYSNAFRQHWENVYKAPWVDQQTSEDAAWRSAKLKSDIYLNHLQALAKHVKKYSNGKVKCYIPTHSILNYSLWDIISPENRLNDIAEIDGYIGQVWTGTARTPIYYDNLYKERTFENAYLEYASLHAMASAGDKEIFFLTDPIEDAYDHTWTDYRQNYHKTFIAQLMFSETATYEVMPWPDRIYFKKFLNESGNMTTISKSYATELAILFNVLNTIPKEEEINQSRVAVMLSHTLMYQRNFDKEIDPRCANFYGLALPLLKHGLPVNVSLLEDFETSIGDNEVLLMTYENMKPLRKEYHQQIVNWVNEGGTLLFFGENKNGFNQINEWWTEEGFDYPAEHLFQLMNLNVQQTDYQRFEKGKVKIISEMPSQYVLDPSRDDFLRKEVKKALGSEANWDETNALLKQRSHYLMADVMDESIHDRPLTLEGNYVDLLSDSLPIISEKKLYPNDHALLIDLDNLKRTPCKVLASSSRFRDEKFTSNRFTASIEGPISADGIARLYSQRKPDLILLDNNEIEYEWDERSSTFLISYENTAERRRLEVIF